MRAHFEYLEGWLAETLEAGRQGKVFQFGAGPEGEAQALMATVHGAMLSARVLGDPQVFALVTDIQLARFLAPDAG